MQRLRVTRLAAAIAVTVPLAMSGCATLSSDKETAAIAAAAAQAVAKDGTSPPQASAPGAAPPAGAPAAAAGVAAAAAAAAAAAQAQKPFADVIKDAKETKGLFN